MDRKEKRQREEHVLRMLIENRFLVSRVEFQQAINSIPIVFKDYPEIKRLNKEFYNVIETENRQGIQTGRRNELLWSLILQIARELGYSKNLEEADIRKIFIIKK